MGRGNYGTVWRAVDKRNRERVAIKKINGAFRDIIDAQRSLREIMILSEIRNHPNVIRIFNVKVDKKGRDLYLILEFADADLLTLIRAQMCSNEQRKFIMYQVARGLLFLHTAKIMHRDIKPANLMVNQNCSAKIADFGLARIYNDKKVGKKKEEPMTDYVATRWYRPPEVLLGSNTYGSPVDIWGFGCTLVELFIGHPLFPGSSTLN
jgi:mitogen-activated protein kinase 15